MSFKTLATKMFSKMDTILARKQDFASQHLCHYASEWPHVHCKSPYYAFK